ncbi:Uncharacterised protein [Mycobacteroides abscessus subsp. abscessus]|nr:Uncharacterised protein [Mycobacteroides abscessus subsp. abscessus]
MPDGLVWNLHAFRNIGVGVVLEARFLHGGGQRHDDALFGDMHLQAGGDDSFAVVDRSGAEAESDVGADALLAHLLLALGVLHRRGRRRCTGSAEQQGDHDQGRGQEERGQCRSGNRQFLFVCPQSEGHLNGVH